jgi:hypothetical protein
MPDPNPIQQLQRRLVELGCPANAVRRIVRETAEHYEDLQRAAQAQGLPPADSTARAAEQLGDPNVLAERHIEALRKSSWWGRCPHFAFGILPLVVAEGLGLLYFSLNGGKLPMDLDGLPLRHPEMVEWAYSAFFVAVIAVTALVTFYFFRKAQRFVVGRRWLWITGGVLAAHSLLLQIHASSGIGLILNQPVALSDQKVTSGHSMEIQIGGMWAKPDRLALYHDETDGGNPEERFVAMPEGWSGNKQKQWKTYPDPDMEEKINLGVAELRERSLRGQLPPHSLHDPGWTAWAFSARWQTAWTNGPVGTTTSLEVIRDDAGNLNWIFRTGEVAPWPVLSYGLPGIGYGQIFQAINIATPLLIVAAMLALQRSAANRLLHESPRGRARLVGAA